MRNDSFAWCKNMTFMYSFSVFETMFDLYIQTQLTARCQQVFLDPKKFLGVASVADAVEYLHSGRSVGKVRRFLQAYNNNRRPYYFCSNASCNFQCYLFRSSFAWIHPTARPLLSYRAQTYELQCVNRKILRILLQIPGLSDWKMTARSPLHLRAELRHMFRLGSI